MSVLKFMDGPLINKEINSEIIKQVPVTIRCKFRSGESLSIRRNKIVRYLRKGKSKKYFLLSDPKMPEYFT